MSKIKTAKVPTLSSISAIFTVGWGSGYIGVNNKHPWFGLHYNEIMNKVEVPIELTFSDFFNCETKQKTTDIWWIGFDTAHYCNGPHHDEKYVDGKIQELKSLAESVVK